MGGDSMRQTSAVFICKAKRRSGNTVTCLGAHRVTCLVEGLWVAPVVALTVV